ncbi:MAG: GtrA family protein [Lentisphaerae bacterium]|nr:GtrA family protein [Lentisphaerota bacterium]
MNRILQQFFQREASPPIQFIKYAICGAVATGTFVGLFYALSWRLLPALTPDDPLVKLLGATLPPIEAAVRERHFIVNNLVAFLVANLVAYISNILWVFIPGRHHWALEIGLFYLVSGASWLIGTTLGWVLIHYLGARTTIALVCEVAASALINFVMRKFVIFKG